MSSEHVSRVEYNDDNPWRDAITLRTLYHHEGMSLPQIADRFEITHQAVLYWFKKHGISRRHPSSDKKGKQTIFCSYCGERFAVKQSNLGTRKFCSRKCSFAGYEKSDYTQEQHRCEFCGAAFKSRPNRKYCSHGCYANDLYEGKQPLKRLFRRREVERGWRQEVFSRDDYTCQDCGEKGGDLEAHHITHVADIISEIDSREEISGHELFNKVSNGVTLCVSCHGDRHAKTDSI